MSHSKFQLKQKLHYTSENSKELGYQYGQCRVYREAPGKVVIEVSEDPRKRDLSQIRSVHVGKHDNRLCIRTKDDIKHLTFDSKSDMMAWCNTINGLIQSDNIEEEDCFHDNEGASTPLIRQRAQTLQNRRQAPRGNGPTRLVNSSPATPGDMFRQEVHSVRELKPVSPDDHSPCYVNSNFNPQLLEQRDAYVYQHELTKLQEENYQPLIYAHKEDTDKDHQEVDPGEDDYENVSEILPSQPPPLTSKKNESEHPSGPARRKALLPPKIKKEKMARQQSQHPHPASQNSSGSIISRPGDLRSNESIVSRPGSLRSNESIVSRPGSLRSNENGYHTLEQDHPLPIHDQQWTTWRQPTDRDDDSASQSHITEVFPDQRNTQSDADQLRNLLLPKEGKHSRDEMSISGRKDKKRPPMPPPKHLKPKPTAQVMPQSSTGDDIYANEEYPLDHHGREPEAKCDIEERVRTIRRRDGTVSSFEVEKNVQIPRREYKVEDVCFADSDRRIIIQRTNLSTYLEVGDQILQINDIDVEHKGKDFAHICLNSVSSTQINLKILRRFHPK